MRFRPRAAVYQNTDSLAAEPRTSYGTTLDFRSAVTWRLTSSTRSRARFGQLFSTGSRDTRAVAAGGDGGLGDATARRGLELTRYGTAIVGFLWRVEGKQWKTANSYYGVAMPRVSAMSIVSVRAISVC